MPISLNPGQFRVGIPVGHWLLSRGTLLVLQGTGRANAATPADKSKNRQDVRTILRLTHTLGLPVHEIGLRPRLGKTTMSSTLYRERQAELNCWPLPAGQSVSARSIPVNGYQCTNANRNMMLAKPQSERII